MDVLAMAREIIENLGGQENILIINNCMTRLRITVKSENKVNFDNLEKLSYIMKVIKSDTLQLVVGPGKSKKIAEEMKNYCGVKENEEWKKNKEEIKSKQGKMSRILKSLANIFVPLIPAIIGAGLLNGIAGYFQNVYTVEGIKELPLWITFFQTLGGGLFGYFAIFAGVNAAKEFGGTPALGGVIGIIIAVAILSYLEKLLRRIVPDFLDTIITPTVSLLIVGTLTIFMIMPFAGVISDGIIKVLSFFILSEGPMAIIGGFILAASFLPLVMVGLHHGLIPFYMVQLTQTGAISLFPILAMAGGGQIGTAAAIYLKAKNNEKLRNIIRSAMPVGILGIGEPMLYGVTLPLGKPFITASIAGGLGGAFLAATKVQTIAFGPSGITAIPLVVPDKIIYYILGLLITYVSGFIITYLFGIPKNIEEK